MFLHLTKQCVPVQRSQQRFDDFTVRIHYFLQESDVTARQNLQRHTESHLLLVQCQRFRNCMSNAEIIDLTGGWELIVGMVVSSVVGQRNTEEKNTLTLVSVCIILESEALAMLKFWTL